MLAVPVRVRPARNAPVRWAKSDADLAPADNFRSQPHRRTATGEAPKVACLEAVEEKTGNRNVRVLNYESSQAISLVTVGVGAQKAPWRCLVSNDGVVAELAFERQAGGNSGRASKGGAAYDAKVAGTDFNVTGILSSLRATGKPLANCKFGVIRQGNGNALITVFWPDGGSRVIFF